ncbi:MAG: hypothetical protein HQ546_08920 [Planctomycetes bacterium]|nr:hypothetical protein [Planctomycetota bacterium]
MTDLHTVIETNAEGPASASADGVSTSQHNLKDQIEVDKYLAAKTSRTNPALGLVFQRIVPPGTI